MFFGLRIRSGAAHIQATGLVRSEGLNRSVVIDQMIGRGIHKVRSKKIILKKLKIIVDKKDTMWYYKQVAGNG